MISDKKSGEEENEESILSPKVLEIIVCPVTRNILKFDKTNQELVSEAAGLAFPIRNGIPILLVDEARKLD
jgi:uncharacterized protein YbaR (Trm112 family)